MTGTDRLKRTIQACRRAGLPVVDEQDCTCALRGRLVVIGGPGGLEVVWPYNRRCPVHAPRDREGPRRSRRPRESRSRSRAAREAWARRKAGE